MNHSRLSTGWMKTIYNITIYFSTEHFEHSANNVGSSHYKELNKCSISIDVLHVLTLYRSKFSVLTKVPLLSFTDIAAADLRTKEAIKTR